MTALEIFEELVKSYTTIFNMALNRPRETIVNWEGVDFVKKELKALEILKQFLYIDEENTLRLKNGKNLNLSGIIFTQQSTIDLLKEIIQ